MLERVLVQQVRPVEEEYRVNPLFGALLDVATCGIEQAPAVAAAEMPSARQSWR